MKVTKLIREYVAEQVAANYPETEAEKLYKEKIAEIRDKAEELNKKIKDYALVLCEQANKDLNITDWEEDDRFHFRGFSNYISSGYNNPYARELNSLEDNRRKKTDSVIKDILINLELGATRAELDEMLKNLK